MLNVKRAELLFFYDARMCNPNGDPDENRPRIDKLNNKNYVTEFRLKRTIRDHLHQVMQKQIFMRQDIMKSGIVKDIEKLAEPYIKKGTLDKQRLISDHIDIRLFGILFTVKKINFKQLGPVQFSIGYSLNKVEEIPIRLTRVVPTKENARAGTFGEKSIIRYSFLQFHGFVNNNVAVEVNLSEESVNDMLVAMWKGTDSLMTSSKFGQKSRLLIKVNYKDDGYIGDLDLKSKLDDSEKEFEDINNLKLDVTDLLEVLTENKDIIESIQYESDNQLQCKYNSVESDFMQIIEDWSKSNKIKSQNLEIYS